jgi:hypothetical protein
MRTPAYSKPAAQTSSFAPLNLYGPGGRGLINPRNYTRNPTGSRPSRVNEQNRQRFSPDVNRIATQYRLDPALMHAVISAESSYNPWAVSPKGAMGLMQLMPGTAERFGVANPYDPIANMHGGARYLRWLLDQFNDTRLAVAAYNAGEGAVQKYGNQIPPYPETQTYVVRVLNFYQQYRLNGPYAAGSYGTVAYNTGSGGGPLASNSDYSGGSTHYRSGSGVTIITPRARNLPAGTVAISGSGSATIPRTYLTPTGTRIIVGGSSAGNSGASRAVVKTNSPAKATATAVAPLFAGNDK